MTLRFQNKNIYPAEMKIVYDDFPNEMALLVIEEKKFRNPEAKKIQEAGELKNIDKNFHGRVKSARNFGLQRNNRGMKNWLLK